MANRYRRNTQTCGCDDNSTADVNAAGIAADEAEEAANAAERRCESFSDPVCISADKVYDACRERNCIVDARVYLTPANQEIIDDAINVKIKKAEITSVYTDIEPVLYNSGYYSVDAKYFIDVTLESFCGAGAPEEIHGLVTYDKRVILYGSEGRTKIFKSTLESNEAIETVTASSNMPTVAIEAVDPIVLSARLSEAETDSCCTNIPENVSSCYGEELVVDDNVKKVLVSMGLFTIVRIERTVQLLVDAVDFCIPEKTCNSSDQEPCELFNSIRFPIDEFFPPAGSSDSAASSCGCGS